MKKDKDSKAIERLYQRILIALVVFILSVLGFSTYQQFSSRDKLITATLLSYDSQFTELLTDFDRKAISLANTAGLIYKMKHLHNCEEDHDSVIFSLLEKELFHFQQAIGLGLWFEPFKLHSEKKYYGPYCFYQDSTIVRTFDYSTSSYDYFSWEWYTNCLPPRWDRSQRREQNTYWSKAYFDLGPTKSPMITIASPIYNNDTIIGVSTVDVGLTNLKEFAENVKITENSKSVILQSQEKVIIHSSFDEDDVLSSYADNVKLIDLSNKVKIDAYQIESIRLNGEFYRSYAFYNDKGFIYVILIPLKDFISPLISVLLRSFLLAFVLYLLVRFLINRTIKHLNKMNVEISDLNKYLTAVMDTVPDVIFIHNDKGEFVEVNSSFERSFKLAKKDISKFKVKDLSGEKMTQDDAMQKVTTAMEKGSCDFEWTSRRSNGEEFPSLVRLRSFIMNEQKFILAVNTDITEIKRKEKQIKEINDNLELLVLDRTRQLEEAVQKLELENEKRKITEKELIQSNEELTVLNETIADDTKRLLILNDNLAKSEQLLKEANIAKDKFISIMAHDLKNPLHAILLSSDFVIDRFDEIDRDTLISSVKTTNKSIKHILQLVENLLMWSRSKSGRMEFNPEYLHLNVIIQDAIELHIKAADKKKIRLNFIESRDIRMVADKNMISVVVRNLVNNAIKYSKPGGSVDIAFIVAENNEFIEISVEDNGIGMTQEQVASLFHPDLALSTKGTHDESGTGLGLLLCSEFVEQHQGRISVESQIGKGSKFVVRLPLLVRQ